MNTIGFSLRQAVTPELQQKALFVLQYLWDNNKTVYFSDHTLLSIGDVLPPEKRLRIDSAKNLDLFIFFGGDGTLLKSLHLYAPEIFNIPILGVHAGTLGFFSSVLPEEAPKALENIFSQKGFWKDSRMVLKGVLKDESGIIEKEFYALNECTIHHAGIARLRNLSTWVNDDFLTHYKADGLIVATPSGSTAYNLAAGGPVLSVDMDAMVITPLAPAGFAQRPIVVSADKKITIRVDANMLISVDGQEYFRFSEGYSLEITKYHFPLLFLRQEHEEYFATLREKLGWGK